MKNPVSLNPPTDKYQLLVPLLKGPHMPKNTSVLLGDHFNRFIAKSIASGRYSSASEVIRAGLRLLEAETTLLKSTRKALIAGEKSGYLRVFDPEKHLKKIRRQK